LAAPNLSNVQETALARASGEPNLSIERGESQIAPKRIEERITPQVAQSGIPHAPSQFQFLKRSICHPKLSVNLGISVMPPVTITPP
jgi:hypothetical protein